MPTIEEAKEWGQAWGVAGKDIWIYEPSIDEFVMEAYCVSFPHDLRVPAVVACKNKGNGEYTIGLAVSKL